MKNFFCAAADVWLDRWASEGVDVYAMDGTHTTVVIPRNPLFEFCMDRLGWSY